MEPTAHLQKTAMTLRFTVEEHFALLVTAASLVEPALPVGRGATDAPDGATAEHRLL